LAFVSDILAGDIRAAGRLMRGIDMQLPESLETLTHLYPHTGRAHIVGVSGSPGAGKSTLITGLISAFREQGKTLGILLLDPTSPYSTGAILGDRVRMQTHALDKNVFIHSTATRGNTGGLSLAVPGIVAVMDAMGKEIIIVETVGAGQDEVDIRHLAHTNVIVVTPTMGDDMQALKAGILETAHIFALNQSDHADAETAHHLLKAMIQLSQKDDAAWRPPVIKTIAVHHQGISELAEQIAHHKHHLEKVESPKQTSDHMQGLLALILRERFMDTLRVELSENSRWKKLLERMAQRKIDPYAAAEKVLKQLTHT